jgi:hypothetical protein
MAPTRKTFPMVISGFPKWLRPSTFLQSNKHTIQINDWMIIIIINKEDLDWSQIMKFKQWKRSSAKNTVLPIC